MPGMLLLAALSPCCTACKRAITNVFARILSNIPMHGTIKPLQVSTPPSTRSKFTLTPLCAARDTHAQPFTDGRSAIDESLESSSE